MIKEFGAFIKKGNLVALSVAFIMGATFAAVVTAFTNIILSFVTAIFGGTSQFVDLIWCVGGSCAQPGSSGSARHESFTGTPIPIGAFFNAVITFIVVAFVLFLIVKAYNKYILKQEAATTKPCPFCKSDISVAATRCPNCTSELSEATPPAPPVTAPT